MPPNDESAAQTPTDDKALLSISSVAADAGSYVPPPQLLQSVVVRSTDERGNAVVTMSAEAFTKLLEAALNPGFDEVSYLTKYADIRAGVEAGVIPSGLRHYASYGYFEGRAPLRCVFDAEWYVATYPDVERAINSGQVRDAAHHFELFGYAEGRVPSSTFQATVGEWHRLAGARPSAAEDI